MTGYLNTDQKVRRPRAALTANGNVILDAIKIDVTSNNNFQADRCQLSLHMSPDTRYNQSWWETQPQIELELKVGFLRDGDPEPKPGETPAGWTTVFQGVVDSIEWHPHTGLIEVEAQDYSSLLMQAKTAETFQNQTSSQVAATLAARHGLTTDIETTSTLVGVYYKQDHDKISLGSFHSSTTEWQLLVYLAQQEGFNVWCSGKTLHFKRPVADTAQPYLVKIETDQTNKIVSANVNDPRFFRDLNKSKDIKVEVKSWNSKQKSSHVFRAGGGSSGSKGKEGTSAQTYTYILPGLSAAQAQAEANKRYQLLTQLERRLSYDEPGNLDYDVRSNIVVEGTNTGWDTRYFIESMTRTISFEGGFKTSVRARNHSTLSQSLV